MNETYYALAFAGGYIGVKLLLRWLVDKIENS